ncbi:MAG: ATP-binding protein [Clostridia bacterium]|nr:ATP-binding protein [Clostridia bacterium]
MKRKIYDKLLDWKHREGGRTALLIDGARRVGKSYIAKAFAEAEYKSYILIDFNRAPREVVELFDYYLNDLDTLFMYLSNFYGTKLFARESLIILDEVQLCPRARSAVKYLVADGRYDYLETGSLMSIKKNVRDILIPSEEEHIKMYPLDFEEFLWALDNDMLMPFIRDCYEKKQPMGQAMHRKAMDYFRQYMIVGGMPQAVERYVETRDFDSVDRIKRAILELYRADIVKHAEGYEMKVEQIFDDIPAQLQKHDKKFKLSLLKKEARLRAYEDAMFWLSDAMIVNVCYNSTAPSVGLKLNMDRMTLKCYMADTGLLVSHAFDENGIVSEEIYKKLLFDKLEVNKGMIVENIVAQMLVASGHKLYFYANPDRDDVTERMEIDFLIAKSKISNRHNISPIKVKSGKNYTLNSLEKFKTKFDEQTYLPYVLHPGDYKEENGIVYLPLYMTPLL